jgi:hypothetical protein
VNPLAKTSFFGLQHVAGSPPLVQTTLDLETLSSLDTHLIGRILSKLDLEPGEAELLDEIPSETSPDERRFLRQFMTHVWDGTGDVIEIGPLFGGTTRALGLGMIRNPRRTTGTFATVDRFGAYYEGRRLIETLGPLLTKKGCFDAVRPHLERGSFVEAFHAIHDPTPYGPILSTVEAALPDRPTDPLPLELVQLAERTQDLAVLFVDGCKSWYSVKALFRLLLGKLRVGGYVLFQDYGWYTCFWIPAFCGAMERFFQPVARVDGTYVFRYAGGMSRAALDSFPDAPQSWSSTQFDALFGRLIEQAHDEGNTYGLTHYPLQWSAALATIGQVDGARRLIDQVAGHPASRRYLRLIEQCRRQPTYTPDGPVTLDRTVNPLASASAFISADVIQSILLTAEGIVVQIACASCGKAFASRQGTIAGIALGRHRCPACQHEVIIGPDEFDRAANRLQPMATLAEMVAMTNEASRITEHWYRHAPLDELLRFDEVPLGESAERFIVPLVTLGLLQIAARRSAA